ncbi:MAG TPA: DUF885 family protein [Bryobacteraceae bacterium]|nr:DUF885 family protein [Bryobacteraceae bacterium]
MNTQAARTIATLFMSAALVCAQPVRRPPAAPYQAPDALRILGPAPADLGPLLERYASDRESLRRFYDVQFSPTTERVMRQFYEAWLAALQPIRCDSLPQEGRIDYLLFRNKLDHEIRQLDLNRKRAEEIAELIPFAPAIIELKEARQRVDPLDPSAAAATVEQLAKQMDDLSKRINDPAKAGGIEVRKTVAFRAARTVDHLRDTLKAWFEFYNGYDPLFTWWVTQPYQKTAAAMEKYAILIREKLAGIKPDDRDTIVGDAVGRDMLVSELAYEMIPYTPEEIVEIANREFAWCDAEMLRASRDLGYGDDWKKALEHVKNDYVPPGQQPAFIQGLVLEAIDFVQSHNLVTVPPLAAQTWRMEMMSPERQRINPFFTGGEILSVSYPIESMTEEQKLMGMRGNNRHFSRATAFHEVIPGHFLQEFMSERYRPYRGIFETPFSVEGWALHWEMLLWDHGFTKTPEDRIGALFWRMHRCARIIFSLSFHLGKMTAQECVDFLVNRVGFERENAAGEVRRSFESGYYGPLYQVAYMLGALQFRALHKDLVGSGKIADREFHDAILKMNAIPIEMVRASLTKQQLDAGFVSNWKFYGPSP